jgi:hypothetical protein
MATMTPTPTTARILSNTNGFDTCIAILDMIYRTFQDLHVNREKIL